jgi:hypothetical protein
MFWARLLLAAGTDTSEIDREIDDIEISGLLFWKRHIVAIRGEPIGQTATAQTVEMVMGSRDGIEAGRCPGVEGFGGQAEADEGFENPIHGRAGYAGDADPHILEYLVG